MLKLHEIPIGQLLFYLMRGIALNCKKSFLGEFYDCYTETLDISQHTQVKFMGKTDTRKIYGSNSHFI